MCLCVQWVGSAEVAISWRHNVLLISGLSRHVRSLQAEREKKVRLSQSKWWKPLRKSLVLAPGSPSFQACAHCAFCQRSPGKLLFLY